MSFVSPWPAALTTFDPRPIGIVETRGVNERSPSMNTPNRNNSITRAAIAHHTIKTYVRGLCSIRRGRHPELATPNRAADEWRATTDVPAPGLNTPTPEPRPQLIDVLNTLATGWKEALRAFGEGDITAAEVRLTLYKDQHPADAKLEPTAQTGTAATARAGDSIPMLRWLLTQATGSIANVAHQLETRAAEIDDDARLELQDDLIALDEELVVVKALLNQAIDWDEENRRLLAGEIPPLESEPDDDEDA